MRWATEKLRWNNYSYLRLALCYRTCGHLSRVNSSGMNMLLLLVTLGLACRSARHFLYIYFPDRSQFTNIRKSFEAMVPYSRVSHGNFCIIPWTLAFESWKRKISSKHRGIASPCSMCFYWWCSYVQLMLAKHNSLIPRQSITKIWLPLQQLWYKV